MRITITGINFQYDNGFSEEYTGVQLTYITSGFNMSSSGEPISITKEQYEEHRQNKDGLKILVAEKIIAEASKFIDDLNAYKDSMQPTENAE